MKRTEINRTLCSQEELRARDVCDKLVAMLTG